MFYSKSANLSKFPKKISQNKTKIFENLGVTLMVMSIKSNNFGSV